MNGHDYNDNFNPAGEPDLDIERAIEDIGRKRLERYVAERADEYPYAFERSVDSVPYGSTFANYETVSVIEAGMEEAIGEVLSSAWGDGTLDLVDGRYEWSPK